MNLPIEVEVPAAVPQSTWRDWLGIVASVGCAIHCAAMPFVFAYLPSLGLSFLADEAFHKWMFVVCMGIGLTAFVPGWKLHRRLIPVSIAGVGLTFIGFAAFGLAGECCAACEVGAASETEDEEACACCADGSCAHDTSNVDGVVSSPSDPSSTQIETASTPTVIQASFPGSDFLAPYAPWITPIGGILLVCAHLLNRRYGCRCGCCESPATSS